MIGTGINLNIYSQDFVEEVMKNAYPQLKLNNVSPHHYVGPPRIMNEGENRMFFGFLTLGGIGGNPAVGQDGFIIKIPWQDLTWDMEVYLTSRSTANAGFGAPFQYYGLFKSVDYYGNEPAYGYVNIYFVGWQLDFDKVPAPPGSVVAPVTDETPAPSGAWYISSFVLDSRSGTNNRTFNFLLTVVGATGESCEVGFDSWFYLPALGDMFAAGARINDEDTYTASEHVSFIMTPDASAVIPVRIDIGDDSSLNFSLRLFSVTGGAPIGYPSTVEMTINQNDPYP